ncbi:hypothetical protein M404DRAFT_685975 [Pisolithus tinctorius Marx 270]|uniref:Uncharacterized protein n=1 Tax=Pisolithus tinctorius Marx 270 TaxID=870435 RepID=A0A0C3KSX4_PISTI|nr:hypothetical protein M404DRAFT_685975 [Pisolithus tinctorius Marx 270]
MCCATDCHHREFRSPVYARVMHRARRNFCWVASPASLSLMESPVNMFPTSLL